MEIANPSTKTLDFVCFHGAKKINIDPPYAQSMDLTTMLLKPKHRSSVFTKDGSLPPCWRSLDFERVSNCWWASWMLRSQQNCFQLQIDGCVSASIAMKDLGLVDSAADNWWVISLSSQRLCPPRCSMAMLLDMLQELEDILFDPRSMGIWKILSSSSPQEDKMTENKQARQRWERERDTGREKLREKLRTWAHWQEGNKWVRCWDVHCRLAQAHCIGAATCAAH